MLPRIDEVTGSGGDVRVFEAGSVTLESGAELHDARLVYAVHGTLSPSGDNAVLLPTCYGGRHEDNEYLIGPDQALDTGRYCVIVPNLLSNGVSSSPSTTSAPFPRVTIRDNVDLQHRMLTEQLGVEKLELVIGFSMGGQQAYQWASRYPSFVRRMATICSAARTSPHTWVFLEGIKAALLAGGELEPDRGRVTVGKRAMARVWAAWGLSQTWYRQRRYEQEGYDTVEAFVHGNWDPSFEDWDSRDLLCLLHTWQDHDIGGPGASQADFEAAMAAITAPTLVMPGLTDLYFPPEDSTDEVALLAHGRLAVIQSVFGHDAGGGVDPADLAFMRDEVRALLASDAPG
jgi:homoserine O-acetyltransferase/O-succinyltransferase